MVPVLSASSLALTDLDPVCGLVAGSGKAGSVNESFNQTKIVTIFCYPVPTKPSEGCAKDKACKMGYPNPWENQESGIVGHQAQIALAGRYLPTDKSVTRGGFSCCGAKQQTGDWAVFTVESDILHVFTDMPFASEIVVPIHQAMKQVIGGPTVLYRY